MEEPGARVILDDPLLAKYRYFLEADRRYKPYQLTEPEEQIIIEKGVTGSSAWARFFTQLNQRLSLRLVGRRGKYVPCAGQAL